MARGYDEPFTLYGLLARNGRDRRGAQLCDLHARPGGALLRRQAGDRRRRPVFSWQLLRDKGRPNHRTYYSKVAKAEMVAERAVRFDLAGSDDRELPLILGLMPVLAKHAINPETFEETSIADAARQRSLVVGQVDPGRASPSSAIRTIGGAIFAINRGFWNFDEIRFDYYRDANSITRRSRGACSTCARRRSRPLADGLRFPRAARRPGRQGSFTSGLPKPSLPSCSIRGAPVFADIRVREAIALLFDFEWVNHSIFFDLYRRSASYFEGSELSALGRPADERERALLAPSPTRCAPTCSSHGEGIRGRRPARRCSFAATNTAARPARVTKRPMVSVSSSPIDAPSRSLGAFGFATRLLPNSLGRH